MFRPGICGRKSVALFGTKSSPASRKKPKTGPHRATNHPGRPRHAHFRGVHLFYGRLLGSDQEILGSTAKPSRARVRRGAALHDVLAGTFVVETELPSALPLCRQM